MPGHFANSSSALLPPSSIDTFVGCPYKWYVQRILKVPEPEEDRFDRKKAGIATHTFWEEQWNKLLQNSISDLRENWAQNLDTAINTHYPELTTLHRQLYTVKEGVGRLLDLQQTLYDALKPSILCTYIELPLPSWNNVTGGKADRVDLLHSGEVIIWDYKAGTSTNYNTSLQLALYGELLCQIFGDSKTAPIRIPSQEERHLYDQLKKVESRERISWAFLGAADGAVTGLFTEALQNQLPASIKEFLPKNKASTLETRWKKLTQTLADFEDCSQNETWAPAYTKHPNPTECRTCLYKGLCRKGEFKSQNEDENEDDSHDTD